MRHIYPLLDLRIDLRTVSFQIADSVNVILTPKPSPGAGTHRVCLAKVSLICHDLSIIKQPQPIDQLIESIPDLAVILPCRKIKDVALYQ